MSDNELLFLNAWNAIPGVGNATLRALKQNFLNFADAWRAAEDALANARIAPAALHAIMQKKKTIDPDRAWQQLVRAQIQIIPESDNHYPALLKEIPNPPLALYYKGAMPPANVNQMPCIAIVGTRRPTRYGLEAAEMFSTRLADSGVCVVSGLAVGIDAKAHAAALASSGRTIAVLGSGIDERSLFPQENCGLARRIVEQEGAVISEYAPGTPGAKAHFPQRNRIIAGLSQGTLVVEARERSGALITARFALEQNREVFAIPGSIASPTSVGPHKLIQEGAKLVTSVRDMLEELGVDQSVPNHVPNASGQSSDESAILALLEEPCTIDTLKEKTHITISDIIAVLSLLEMKGAVCNLGQDMYQRTMV